MKIVEVHCTLLYIIHFMHVDMKETEYTEYVQKKILIQDTEKKYSLHINKMLPHQQLL